MSGLEGVWKACGGVKMGCIMTPMPNHLSTCLSFYYSSFDEWGGVDEKSGEEEKSSVGKGHTKEKEEKNNTTG